jgi:hypothetical protein
VVPREELFKMDKKMVCFLWAGNKTTAQHRVNYATVIQPKQEGGLGYIGIPDQVNCLAAKFVLWTVSDREDELKAILSRRIRELSLRKWGVHNYLWVYVDSNLLPTEGSQA